MPAFDHETAALNSPKSSWWDDEFTRLLLEVVPADARQIVEIGCGNARSAHSLLPSLPDAEYIGISAKEHLVKEAEAGLAKFPYHRRAKIRLGKVNALRLDDESADVTLSLMTLQHSRHVEEAVAEVHRVLRVGGRFVTIEPDNLGQRFYFNGGLEVINDVYHKLCLRARVARQPADIAIGPRISQLMQGAGFTGIRVAVHAIHSSRTEDAKSFFARLRKICRSTAENAGLAEDTDEIAACEEAINRCLYAGMPQRIGFSTHLVPVFRCVAEKPRLSGEHSAVR